MNFSLATSFIKSELPLGSRGVGSIKTCRASRPRVPNDSDSKSNVQREQRGSKQDVDAILSNMGLTPVASKKKQQQTYKPESRESVSGSTNVSPKEIPLQTQLDYARNGHAVLRNFVNSESLETIRKSILKLASDEELGAWRQKVGNKETYCCVLVMLFH
jgi:hypothetical protein